MAEGPMSTPRRPDPRSMGTPMTCTVRALRGGIEVPSAECRVPSGEWRIRASAHSELGTRNLELSVDQPEGHDQRHVRRRIVPTDRLAGGGALRALEGH